MSAQTPTLPLTAAPQPAAPTATTSAIVINGELRLPANLTTHEAFRKWARSDDCPEKGRFGYLAGELWVEVSMEQFYTHNQVKEAIGRRLGNLVEESNAGRYAPDGMLLSYPPTTLSTMPDGLFVSYEAFRTGKVKQVAGTSTKGVIELEGTPEMVLEEVSKSSVDKDFVTLPELYYRTGISEFWRVDARDALQFEILRWTDAGYTSTQLPDGWWRSAVFGRDFLLTWQPDPLGMPRFTLQARP
jgi:Uma2 family endonuclease